MRILIVSFFFPPFNAIGSLRVGKFAKYLTEIGHEVKVLTVADMPFLQQSLPVEISEANVLRSGWLNVNKPVIRLRRQVTQPSAEGNLGGNRLLAWMGKSYKTLMNFPDGQVGWIPYAYKAGKQMISGWRPDLIYASAMPFSSLIVAARLSKRFDIPWVAEFRDLWTQSNYYEYPSWRRWMENHLENRTLNSASLLVTVSHPLMEMLRARHRKPAVTILNGFDPEDYKLQTDRPVGFDNKFLNIVYTGMIYPEKRDPRPLFSALALLGEAAKDIRVHFYGRMLPGINALAMEYGVSHLVQVHASVSYQQALTLQCQADVLLLLLWNHPSEKGVFSGKLFEYLGARRPILLVGIEDGVAAELIRERSAGVVANEAQVIAMHLRDWLRIKKSVGAIPALPEKVGDGLTRKDQALRLSKALQECLDRSASQLPRPSVLFVVPKMEMGGTERHILMLASGLVQRGFDPSLFVIHGGGALEPHVRQAGVKVLSSPAWLPAWARRIHAAVRLAYAAIASPPACVHAFLPEAAIISGLVMRLFPRMPFFISRRSLNNYQAGHPWLAKLERRLQLRAWKVLANSSMVYSQLIQEGLPRHKIGLIRNGVDLRQFDNHGQREVLRLKLGIPADSLVVAIVANLIAYKGHADLLQALVRVKQELPQGWRLLCAGRDDGEGPRLHAMADECGLSSNILWLGSRSDIPELLATADIAVLPSHQEGFSNSLLEYMAAGLPIVATAVGGNIDAIEDGVTGLLVPPRDADALAKAILRLSCDIGLRQKLAANARRRVAQRHSLELMIRDYEGLYGSDLRLSARKSLKCD